MPGLTRHPFLDLAANLCVGGLRRDGYGVRHRCFAAPARFLAPGLYSRRSPPMHSFAATELVCGEGMHVDLA
jgi:hypothetical protein